MAKAGAKAAARRERAAEIGKEYPPHGANHMLQAFRALGFHRIRRLYIVHRDAGDMETLNNGIWRYMWHEFAPQMAGGAAAWEECEDVLRTLESMLDPRHPAAVTALENHLMELGRLK